LSQHGHKAEWNLRQDFVKRRQKRLVHFRAEGTNEYTALLYLPKHRPMDLFDPDRAKSWLADLSREGRYLEDVY